MVDLPAAVPVPQGSVQPAGAPTHLVQLGRALKPLLREGVLIIGSGHTTHNLGDWMRGRGAAQPYAREFSEWVKEKILEKDFDALVDYRSRNPHGARAHPTDEHFLPLFIALGAAEGERKAERVYEAIDNGVLAMDAYVFQ